MTEGTKNKNKEGLQVMFDENLLGDKEGQSNMSKVISKKRIILCHPGHG